MKLFSSLRTSLILIVLIAIIPSILIILLSGIENRQNLLERSREQAAHTSMQAAGQLARFVEGMRYLLTAISENDAVRSRDTARAGRFLSEIMKHFDHLANLGVLDAGGNVFASGIPLKRAVNLSERLDRKSVV